MAGPMTTPHEIRLDLLARREIALLDLREEADYAQGHPLFAASLPLGRLELEVLERVPRKDTRIVAYHDDDRLAALGFERLASLGYGRLSLLEGGLAGWRKAGFELFQDVNSASKAFGELVEHHRGTPSLGAAEVKALIDAAADLVVLDVRRFEEYQTMSIPRGVNVPGAELVLRAREIAPDSATTIVVNCAGRTRSIIGAQSLINAGLPNPIVALRNGAIGWRLAGLDLDRGASLRFPGVDVARAAPAREAARGVAYRAGVRHVTAAEAEALTADRDRTLYRLDVRTPEEFAAGHLPGFRSAPGGQLVQETDVWAPVRGARLLLADDQGVRADMSASWLAQMGWEVFVLAWEGEGALEAGKPPVLRPPPPDIEAVAPEALAEDLHAGRVTLVDLASSSAYRQGHVPGAWFAIRVQLPAVVRDLPGSGPIVLTSPDGDMARFAAPELIASTDRPVLVLAGGTAAWSACGHPLETGESRMASPPHDVYRRPYEGADVEPGLMQAYLDWEFGLVAQLERDATHGFLVI